MGDEVRDITTETIPDCFFARDRAAEEHGGYLLAGVIIVRQPEVKEEARKGDREVDPATCSSAFC